MTTALLERTTPANPRRAMLALGRVEAVRLLRHPVTVLAALGLIGFWVAAWFTNDANRYPVLRGVDRDSDLGVLLLLGAAALIAGNFAVLRAHRDGTTGLAQVLILPQRARTLAHLLAVLPLAVLGGVLIVARLAVLAVVAPAAGRPDPYEVAIGSATVLLLGALGVLLGRLIRSVVVAPLALLVLLASLVVLPLLAHGGTGQWLQPVVLDGGPAFIAPAPAYLLARPAAAHVGYLLGLAGVLGVAALFAAGARSLRVTVAAVLAVACAATGGIRQLAPPSPAVTNARIAAMEHPSRYQTCRTLDQVRYCAFSDFTRWIPGWQAVVQSVVAQVPAGRRPAQLAIRQRLVVLDQHAGVEPDQVLAAWRADDAAAGTPDAIPVGTRWGDSQAAADLAASVAYHLVGGHGAGAAACGGAGVLVVWLTGRSGAQANAGLHQVLAGGHAEQGGPVDTGGLTFGRDQPIPDVSVPGPELAVALAALQRPAADIATRVAQSWGELTAPGTTAVRAAQILGVPAPSGPAGRCR